MAKNTNDETVVTVDSVVKVKMKVTTAGKDFEEETDDERHASCHRKSLSGKKGR